MGHKDDKWHEALGFCVECDNLHPLNNCAVCEECWNTHPISEDTEWEEDEYYSHWYYQRFPHSNSDKHSNDSNV